MYGVLNTLSEYRYFYISKNVTSYTFLLVLKIVESLQCIPKYNCVQLFSYALLRITITNTYRLLLKQHWFLSKKILKLTDDKSFKLYVPNTMGIFRTP